MTVYIGTSGFDYPEWKGIFYPANLKRKDFLTYYSTVFNALEINSTFYNMPTREQMLSFYERSEGRLTFSIKANRSLTHEITSAWKDQAIVLQQAIGILADKNVLGPVLFQFPPTFDYSVPNRKYLANLLGEFKNFKPVVEFRNAGWVKESVFEGIVARNASIVFTDVPQLRQKPDGTSATKFVGSYAYVRFHEKNNQAWYCQEEKPIYTPAELKLFLPVIQQAKKENRTVSIFFYNHSAGAGVLAAKNLTEML